MTAKEFQRRLAAFSVLDHAASLFIENPNIDFIYKMDQYFDTHHITSFLFTPVIRFTQTYPINLSLLSFERFDRSAFENQFRYFEGFLNCLSSFQLDFLMRSGKVDNLLKYPKCESSE